MLRQLAITNIAIVDALSIDWGPGLTVITGETGAGKSIMMDALLLAFGEKASPKDVLRHGVARGGVELLCDIGGSRHEAAIRAVLTDAGVELSKDEAELLISREITPTGSRMRINGTPVTREVLIRLRRFLVDVHGQHELTQLFDVECQRAYLDSLGGEALTDLRDGVKTAYSDWQMVHQRLESIRHNRQAYEQQRDFLTYQFNELNEAQLTDAAEDEQLQAELQVLSHAEKLLSHAGKAMTVLSDGAGDQASVLSQVDCVQGLLSEMAECDKRLEGLLEVASTACEQLKQVSGDLARYADRVEYNPERIKELVDRLDVLEKIKRKYGPSLSDAMAKRDAIAVELETMGLDEEGLAQLEKDCAAREKELVSLCQKLTALRQSLAAALNKNLTGELQTLALPAVRFDVAFQQTAPSQDGADAIEFMFSANPGEPLRPLAKVASGGELSRFLLAMKVLSARDEQTPTLVFDEIDTGISGPTAKAVAEKLGHLALRSPRSQVLVITHQPMVAAMGQQHLHVEKTIVNNKGDDAVSVAVRALESETQRLEVLSRLVSGMSTGDEAAARFIGRLLEQARAFYRDNVFGNGSVPAAKKRR